MTYSGCLGVISKNTPVYLDIIQIEVDPPPYFWQIYPWQRVDHVDLPTSPRIFDKNHEILGFEFTFSIILIAFWESGVQTERHRVPWLGQIE